MKKLSLLIVVLTYTAHAQQQPSTVGWGGGTAAAFATTLSQCPIISTGFNICVVDPGGTTLPFLGMSVFDYNSGAPFQLGMQGPQGPQGVQGVPGPPGPSGPGFVPLISSGANSSLAPSATGYYSLSGPHVEASFAASNEAMLPFAGTLDTFCVRTVTMQSGGTLTLNVYDTTTSTATPVTVTVPAQGAASVYCDTTDSATITAQHDYVIKAVNSWTGASATITGISARYSY